MNDFIDEIEDLVEKVETKKYISVNSPIEDRSIIEGVFYTGGEGFTFLESKRTKSNMLIKHGKNTEIIDDKNWLWKYTIKSNNSDKMEFNGKGGVISINGERLVNVSNIHFLLHFNKIITFATFLKITKRVDYGKGFGTLGNSLNMKYPTPVKFWVDSKNKFRIKKIKKYYGDTNK